MNIVRQILDSISDDYKITKPIRLIELFSGYGSQALALKYLGVDFESWRTCEWAVNSIQAYKDIHYPNDNTDYCKGVSEETLNDGLYKLGISSNYNEPMSAKQIEKKSYEWKKQVMNNIIACKNMVNIQQVHAKNLGLSQMDQFTYLLTYSFPCQSLSLAGKQEGFHDNTTRSGMLWEVERILLECEEKPQVLLMENVIQVHSKKNIKDFERWQESLENMGYHNFYMDLNSKDFGIPQNRKRCFMVSIYEPNDYVNYTFPKSTPLNIRLKDLLETNVDSKFYLSEDKIKSIMAWNCYEKPLDDIERDRICSYLTTHCGKDSGGLQLVKTQVVGGIGDKTSNNGKQYFMQNRVYSGDTAITVATCCNPYYTIPNDNKVVVGNYSPSNYNSTRIVDEKGLAPTVMENHGSVTAVLIKNGTKQGYLEAKDGDGIDLSFPDSKNRRGRVQPSSSSTVTTQNNLGVIDNWNIRKLTPNECFRLMGVKDEDFENIAKNQSESSLYHLAGDSIVVNVLMAIFKKLL